MEIPIEKIIPNPEQPRKIFDEAELTALAESISLNGIILPLAAEEAADGFYILHDGERRLRAAKLAGLTKVPVSIVPGMNGTGARDRLVRALVANIQRSDLSPIEEAKAFQRLIDELGLSLNKVAIRIGITSTLIQARLDLLKLDPEIQELIEAKKLPKGNLSTKALLSITDKETRIALAKRLSERQATEKAVIEACSRIKNFVSKPKFQPGEVPSIRIASRKTTVDRAKWDALAQVGRLPPWLLLEISARDTCKKCSLFEMASDSVCRDCPLPVLIESMIGKASK